MIYLDNAATHHPKAPGIPEAVANYLTEVIANPGRGGHKLSRKADGILQSARTRAKQFFNAPSEDQFHFCVNATQGLNFIIQGLLETGGRVITTAIEHNSTLRPLKKMELERRVDVKVVPCNSQGQIHAEDIIKSIRPETSLVVLNHASNVVGTVIDLQPIAEFCYSLGVPLLVDASQTAGILPIDLQTLPIDYLVATGHKGLRGPSGSGLIFARSIVNIAPLLVGGTGGNSLSLHHPRSAEALFHAGSVNYLGIAALDAALEDILEHPADLNREIRLARCLANGLSEIPGVKVYGPADWATVRLPIVSFNLEWMSPQMVLGILDDDFDIIVRAGLHCAPLVHHLMGTAPHGTVRASLGHATTEADIEALIKAMLIIAEDSILRSEERLVT